MIRFNFFNEYDAFAKDEKTGTCRVIFDKMKETMNALSEQILTHQGNGDYDGVVQPVEEKGMIGEVLRSESDRLEEYLGRYCI